MTIVVAGSPSGAVVSRCQSFPLAVMLDARWMAREIGTETRLQAESLAYHVEGNRDHMV